MVETFEQHSRRRQNAPSAGEFVLLGPLSDHSGSFSFRPSAWCNANANVRTFDSKWAVVKGAAQRTRSELKGGSVRKRSLKLFVYEVSKRCGTQALCRDLLDIPGEGL